ncbi:hypothetical protein ACRALDRAFT_212923 [Sodiomyces alcalophilus JCM 7366]|uniref:uncharacterized protein n=1 Tax=Sodiomyces alcalophilus JCM 7366 TaxID=591952 RepID=UPI0039B594FE
MTQKKEASSTSFSGRKLLPPYTFFPPDQRRHFHACSSYVDAPGPPQPCDSGKRGRLLAVMLQHEAPSTSAATRSRSRFSKALPAPPPALDTTRLEPPPTASHASTKELPSIPPLSPLFPLSSPSSLTAPASLARKPVRKPVVTDQSKTPSLRSKPSLPVVRPNLPSQPQPLSPLPSPPPPMSIPRRPVLPPKKQNPPPPQPEPQPPPQPVQHPPLPQVVVGKKEAPVILDEEAQLSATDSIDSLLSAYSFSSDADSLIRSYGDSSQRDSAATGSAEHEVSPEQHDGATNTRREGVAAVAYPREDKDIRLNEDSMEKQQAAQHARDSSPINTAAERVSEKDLPLPPPATLQEEKGPPTPRKDDGGIHGSTTNASSATGLGLAGTVGSSPQHPELWRRRSVKSDESIQLPDLKLASSHGSTAASQPPPSAAVYPPPSTSSTTLRPSQPQDSSSTRGPSISSPQTGPEGSSGKGHPPPPGDQAAGQGPDGHIMGSGCSKLNIKTIQSDANVRAGGREALQAQGTQRGDVSSHSETRRQSDGSARPTPNYEMKSTPSSEAGQAAPITTATIPPTASLDSLPEAVAREGRPVIQRKAVSRESSLRAAQSLPQMGGVSGNTVTGNEVPPIPDPTVRTRDFAAVNSTTPHPNRTSPNQPKILHRPSAGWEQRPGPGWRPGSRSGHVPGPATRPASKVVYRELRLEDLPPPDPSAMRFPKTVQTPAPPGTIFKALPIKKHMLHCHTAHREMRASPQGHYAVACQACGKEDRGERWACTACHVRICGGCRRALAQNGCDLGKLLAHLQSAPG